MQYLPDLDPSVEHQFENVCPVRHQASGIDGLSPRVHRGHLALSHEFDDTSVIEIEHRTREHEESLGVVAAQRGECRVELAGVSGPKKLKLDLERMCSMLGFAYHLLHRLLAVDRGM